MSWSFAGTPLSSAGAYQVTDLSGAQGLAPVRGENAETPLRVGRPHRQKYFEQRRITLGMLVHANTLTTFETNLDTLKALFSTRAQKPLTRTMGDASTRTALAEVVGDLQVAQIAPTVARLTVDFMLADPFFYAAADSTSTVTMDAASKSHTITDTGSAPNYKPVILLTGPLVNLSITHNDQGYSLTYAGTLNASETLEIDCENWTATKTVSMVESNALSTITHAGAAFWFAIQPGSNSLTITTDSGGGGTVLFTWKAAYH